MPSLLVKLANTPQLHACCCCCCCCRGRIRSIITSPSPTTYSPSAGGAPPAAAAAGASSATPILTGSEWELDASSTAIRIVGGSSSCDKAAPSGSSTPAAAAAAAGGVEVLDEYEEDVPPLDLGVLRGQAVTPGNAGLLLQAGEQRRWVAVEVWRGPEG
jgi:hypothetical protein